jgi:hypothetical protein
MLAHLTSSCVDKKARRKAHVAEMKRKLAEDAARSQAQAEQNVKRAAEARTVQAERRRAAGAEVAQQTRQRQRVEADRHRSVLDTEVCSFLMHGSLALGRPLFVLSRCL